MHLKRLCCLGSEGYKCEAVAASLRLDAICNPRDDCVRTCHCFRKFRVAMIKQSLNIVCNGASDGSEFLILLLSSASFISCEIGTIFINRAVFYSEQQKKHRNPRHPCDSSNFLPEERH